VEAACGKHERVAVEGYLLTPALQEIKERIAGKASVIIVQALNREYYTTVSIELIAHG
jgi:hypothetical protein